MRPAGSSRAGSPTALRCGSARSSQRAAHAGGDSMSRCACRRHLGLVAPAALLWRCGVPALAARLPAARSPQEARARAGGDREHADGARVHAAQQPGAGARSHRARARRGPENAERTGDRGPGVRAAQRDSQGEARLLEPLRGWARTIRPSRTAMRDFCAARARLPTGEKLFIEVAQESAVSDPGGGVAQCRRLRGRRGRCGRCGALFQPRAGDSSPNMPEALLQLGNLAFEPRRLQAGARLRAALSGRQSADPGSAVARISRASASSATTPPPPRYAPAHPVRVSAIPSRRRCCAPASIDERGSRKRWVRG